MENLSQAGNTSSLMTSSSGAGRSVVELVVVGATLATIIVVTILGNLLVCVTITTNKKLHNFTNYFILSLATTDLLLGCLVLPFSALNTLAARWPLGAVFCNIYVSTDVTVCTVSILTLFAISLDRYLAITKPLRYQHSMHTSTVLKVNAAIWLFSLLMAYVPIHLGWNTPDGSVQNWRHPDVCAFELNTPYTLLVAGGTYFAPLMVMCVLYFRVFQITRRQVKEINKLSKVGSSGLTQAMFSENGELTTTTTMSARRSPCRHKTTSREHKIVSDRKAIVTLASVVMAFAICWVPYFMLFITKPFINVEVNVHLDLFVLWLGYVNSSINPFLYAFYNSAFREAFRRVLCRRCSDRTPGVHAMTSLRYEGGGGRDTLCHNSDTGSELTYVRNKVG